MYECSVLAPIPYTDTSVLPHMITAHPQAVPHLAKLYTVFPHRISITELPLPLPLHTSFHLPDQQQRHSNSYLTEVTSYRNG